MMKFILLAVFINLTQPFSWTLHQQRVFCKSITRTHTIRRGGDASTDGSESLSFAESLERRVAEVKDRETKLPITVLDSILPRQVLSLETEDLPFLNLVRALVAPEKDGTTFGMVGVAQTRGRQLHGVELRIVDGPQFYSMPLPLSGNMKAGMKLKRPNVEGLKVTVQGGRRFVIKGEVSTCESGGWTEARIEFLDDSSAEPADLAKASALCEELTAPNGQGEDGQFVVGSRGELEFPVSPRLPGELLPEELEESCLVSEWVRLARKNERSEGQIDQLLLDIGSFPPASAPSDRALWIGALINPLPGMGVALEVRPALLSAVTATERVEVALHGIRTSIAHMDGSKPMW